MMNDKIVLLFLILNSCVLLFLLFIVKKILLRIKSSTSVKHLNDYKILNFLSDIYIAVDNTGIIVDINPAFKNAFVDFKFNLRKTKIEDFKNYLLMKTLKKDPVDILQLLCIHNKPIQESAITIEKNGGELNYLLSKDIIDKDGIYSGFIIKLIDISNYYQKTDENNESDLPKITNVDNPVFEKNDTFLENIMNHEIRTPLTAITGMTEIAKKAKDKEKVFESLEKINTAATQLLNIVNNTLDMSKLESGRFILYEEPFVFSDMIQNIVSFNAANMNRKNQNFKTIINKNIPNILFADEMRLSCVINNLLSNAIKFTPHGGNIQLVIKNTGSKNQSVGLQISVIDDGIGISEKMQSKIFTIFKHIDSSYSRQYGKAALGLAISQRIVGLMGGIITVKSEPGKGCNFTFEIDVRFPSKQTAEPVKPNEYKDFTGENAYDFSDYTILFVEDVEINREIVLSLLESTKVKIDCAENGLIAYNMYMSDPQKYNMIYMDIQMPILDGYATTEKIRKKDADIPIIAMTADATVDDIQKCKSFGMNDHIAKPIDVNELLKKTSKYIGKR